MNNILDKFWNGTDIELKNDLYFIADIAIPNMLKNVLIFLYLHLKIMVVYQHLIKRMVKLYDKTQKYIDKLWKKNNVLI